MRKGIMSLVIALLIISNLYTLRAMMELKKANPMIVSPNQSLSRLNSSDFFLGFMDSLDRLSKLIQEQKEHLATLFDTGKDEWQKNTERMSQVRNHLHQIDQEIKELQALKDAIAEKLEKSGNENQGP